MKACLEPSRVEHLTVPLSLGRLLTLLINIIIAWQVLSGSNTPAYLAAESVAKKKRFISFSPRPNFIKTFYFSNLRIFEISWSFFLASLSSIVYFFKAGTYPSAAIDRR
jgi:hypothetical protein